jgi:hypothetical protein
MHPIKTPATLAAIFAGALLSIFAASLAAENQRVYVRCLVDHQSPAYCRLLINGR